MRFTFRQLEIFVEAAKDENFRFTSERLGISQPTISNHVRALEERAGGKLFDRRRGSAARLLPFGAELLVEAKKILETATRVRRAGPASDGQQRTLRVAAGAFIIDYLLRPALARYHVLKNVPHIELLLAMQGRDLAVMLNEGAADIGFYTGEPLDEPGLILEPLCSVSVSLYAAPGLSKEIACMPDICDAPIILAALNSPTDQWFRKVLGDLGIQPRNVAARSQYPDVILELTCQGIGMALLFDDMAATRAAQGQLVRLPFDVPPSSRYMAYIQRFTDQNVLKSISFLRKTVRTAMH